MNQDIVRVHPLQRLLVADDFLAGRLMGTPTAVCAVTAGLAL